MNGLKWAVGNLVANGAHGAKVGAPTDGGLYFQFGSLIGWAGGANGDGTGMPSDSPSYAFNAAGTVVPSGKSIPSTWGDSDSWTGTTGTVPAAFDPCTQYLGSSWRLPTKGEYETLIGTTDEWINGWSWDDDSVSATHTDGLTLLASGNRNADNNSLTSVGMGGYYWSSSLYSDSGGMLFFRAAYPTLGIDQPREYGYPVRCVR